MRRYVNRACIEYSSYVVPLKGQFNSAKGKFIRHREIQVC